MTENSFPSGDSSCVRSRRGLQIGVVLGLLALLTTLWVRGGDQAARQTAAGPTTAGVLPAARQGNTRQTTAPAKPSPVEPDADLSEPEDSATASGSTAEPTQATQPAHDAVEIDDDRLRQMLVGTWEQFYYGKRLLTIRDDGTATMDVRPDGIWAYVVGNRLVIDVKWQVEDGRGIFRSTGGRPESSYKIATSTWGTSFNRPIVEITDEKFVLLKEEDGSKGEWKRVAESE